MGSLLSLVTGWKGYAAIGLACFLAGSLSTWRVMSWREQAHEKQALVKTVQIIERRGKITFDVGMKFEAARLHISQDTQDRQEEVEKHVTPQIDIQYAIPCGFVRVFQSATHGPLPDPSSCADDAASGVAFSTLAHTETENAGQYDAIAAQLIALQDWVRQQQALKP